MFTAKTAALALDVLTLARARHKTLVTAESCTGGLIAASLTAHAGSSAVFDRGFVTYANAAKTTCLGVTETLLATHGAVSSESAASMAVGALAASPADIALSVTGIAGPDGATLGKPVGLVWFGIVQRNQPAHTVHHIFPGNRTEVREAALLAGLALLKTALEQAP